VEQLTQHAKFATAKTQAMLAPLWEGEAPAELAQLFDNGSAGASPSRIRLDEGFQQPQASVDLLVGTDADP
jgi:hypothetical protein